MLYFLTVLLPYSFQFYCEDAEIRDTTTTILGIIAREKNCCGHCFVAEILFSDLYFKEYVKISGNVTYWMLTLPCCKVPKLALFVLTLNPPLSPVYLY